MDLLESPENRAKIKKVIDSLLDAISTNTTVLLPPYDPTQSVSGHVALQSVGCETNPYGATVGDFRFQFEGEEDLLHLFITRTDGNEISPEQGQQVVQAVIPQLPPGLIWFKPGRLTQHFYFGHDDLLAAMRD